MRSTSNMFRTMARLEEAMLRSTMPRASKRSAEPLLAYGVAALKARPAAASKPLTFRMAEVAHA